MKYWISTPKFTCQVNVDRWDRISFTAPVWHRFLGQELHHLLYWLRKLGPVQVVELYPKS